MRLNQEVENKSSLLRRRILRGALAAAALVLSLPTSAFAVDTSDWMTIECNRLPVMRTDSKHGEYLPLRVGARLKRFERVYIYGTPHAQEREFNNAIAERLNASVDAIVYIPERQFFRVVGDEQRCILPPDNPKEVTKESDLDGPPGLAS